jgi:translation initiation factor 4A
MADQTFQYFENTDINVYLGKKSKPGQYGKDISNYKKGKYQVVITTPGRFIDFVNKDIIDLSKLDLFVIDEVDELLKSSTIIDSLREYIFPKMNNKTQILVYSATMTVDVRDICHNFMNKPVEILITDENKKITIPSGITQYYILSEELDKPYIVEDLLTHINVSQCMLFTNSIKSANKINDLLIRKNYKCGIIQSEYTVEEREYTLQQFRNGGLSFLICTDVLSRGIDVQQVSLVINFELKSGKYSDHINYVHRVGRCGRFGRKGTVINLISTSDDTRYLKHIEENYMIDGSSINELTTKVLECL